MSVMTRLASRYSAVTKWKRGASAGWVIASARVDLIAPSIFYAFGRRSPRDALPWSMGTEREKREVARADLVYDCATRAARQSLSPRVAGNGAARSVHGAAEGAVARPSKMPSSTSQAVPGTTMP